MAELRMIREGADDGVRSFPLGDEATLGRDDSCTIVLPDPSISKQHARIKPAGNGFTVQDLGSTNGTFVNGKRVRRARLRDGDTIRIHDVSLVFHEEDAALDTGRIPSGTSMAGSASILATRGTGELVPPPDRPDQAESLRRRLEALYDLSCAAVGTLEAEALLGTILEELLDIFPQADYGFVLTGTSADGDLAVSASTRRNPADPDLQPSTTLVDYAQQEGQAVLSSSPLEDTRFQDARSLLASAATSVLCAPVVVGSDILGAIYLVGLRPGQSFDEDDLQLVVCVAATLAIFLQNARMHGQIVASERLAAIGQAVASLAHCIKNILNGIQSGSFILDQGLAGEDLARVRKGWEITKRNNDFLSNLVLDMLTYGKERKPHYELTSLNKLADTVAGLHQEKARQQGTGLKCELDPGLPDIRIDPVAVYRCILNLVANAVDACADQAGAEVCIRTTREAGDGFLLLEVEDTGCGMTEEVRARLFTEFFSTKGSKGTGLGLPVVIKIVEAHGGRVEVRSEAGEGSVFAVHLPLTATETPPPAPGETLADGPGHAGMAHT